MAFWDMVNFYLEHEKDVLRILALTMFITGFIAFLILLYQPAAYGRYSSTGSYFTIAVPPRLAWFLQEMPAFLVSFTLLVLTQNEYFGKFYTSLQLIVISCFVLHYFQRTFIYSLLITGGKPTPLYTFIMAFIFCTANGYMQARGALLLSSSTADKITLVRVIIGLVLFGIGLLINIHSDGVLRNLRKPGETGYKIPKGAFYEYVSCANFFGEILEWLGFAVASWSSVAFAFSFFTAANLIPRALHHHRWYLRKFEDYPKSRKAVIPFLL